MFDAQLLLNRQMLNKKNVYRIWALSLFYFFTGKRLYKWGGLYGLIIGLGGCVSAGSPAPIVDMSTTVPHHASVKANKPSTTGQYIVRPGDTLNKIARDHHIEVATLERLNHLDNRNQLSVGQSLQIAVVNESTAHKSKLSVSNKAHSLTVAEPLKPKTQALNTSSNHAHDSEKSKGVSAHHSLRASSYKPVPIEHASSLIWMWPAQGALIQGFNPNVKGIDIGGVAGDPVHAAADGTVMYSGNGVRGLGNLVIINHSGDFITAYAHNRVLLVKKGQSVNRGFKIAEMGQTDAKSPRLHFEVRRRGIPVDPLRYLPPR